MDTKVVTPPERTPAVLLTREVELPAPQADSAAKLENAGSIYLSPVVRIDNETQTAVLQYRDPNTGKVLRQFPAKAGSDAYAEQEKRSREADVKVHDVPVQAAPPVKTVAATAPAAVPANNSAKPADTSDVSKSVVA
jgi:hypothetical protein